MGYKAPDQQIIDTLATQSTAIADILVSLNGPVSPAESVLYDGGDTTALRDNTTTSALPTSAAVITITGNTLDVAVQNASAAETLTLCVAEYSAATPTIATLIRQQCVSLGADEGRTVDRANVGLVTGTEHYAKTPVSVDVTPGAYVQLSIVENVTGPCYARYAQRVR